MLLTTKNGERLTIDNNEMITVKRNGREVRVPSANIQRGDKITIYSTDRFMGLSKPDAHLTPRGDEE